MTRRTSAGLRPADTRVSANAATSGQPTGVAALATIAAMACKSERLETLTLSMPL